jgi:Spy/CpxP family protein refolding chaperone
MNAKTIGAAILFAVLPFAALAQSTTSPSSAASPTSSSVDHSEARAKLREACGADVQKFCANVERGKGALRSCLEAHQSDLTAACKAARADRAAARAKEKG